MKYFVISYLKLAESTLNVFLIQLERIFGCNIVLYFAMFFNTVRILRNSLRNLRVFYSIFTRSFYRGRRKIQLQSVIVCILVHSIYVSTGFINTVGFLNNGLTFVNT